MPLKTQSRLLRVLENGEYIRVGSSKVLKTNVRVVAATNVKLLEAVSKGKFREDLYYRLCADVVRTPSLHEQIGDAPAELRHLVGFLVARIVPAEADSVTDEVANWIEESLGSDYAWPGNIRELEQCVRNVLIRNEYRPLSRSSQEPADRLADDVRWNRLTSAELISRYYTQVFNATGSYEQASRLLDVDRRTVKTRMGRD